MKLLLDECVARDVKKDLRGHDVHTAEEAGYKGLKNGELLRAISGTYDDVLITVDQNLPFQQNIRSLQIAVIIIAAGGISYQKLRPLLSDVLEALTTIRPGEFVRIETSR
jgi:predicted nuclease of predicted toxin-antitoxin system